MRAAGALLLLLAGCAGRSCSQGPQAIAPAQVLCVVHGVPGADEGVRPHSVTGTLAEPPEEIHGERRHVHARVLAVPLNAVANRCPRRAELKLVVSTEPGEGGIEVALELAGRRISAQVRRGPGVGVPGSILLEGLGEKSYAPVAEVGGQRYVLPAVQLSD